MALGFAHAQKTGSAGSAPLAPSPALPFFAESLIQTPAAVAPSPRRGRGLG